MKYYKVKPEYDNKTRYTWNNKGQRVRDFILVADELYTPCEFKKIANNPVWFDIVEIPRNKIYFFFGARFANVEVF